MKIKARNYGTSIEENIHERGSGKISFLSSPEEGLSWQRDIFAKYPI
jgi:hypothetical protein